MNRLFLFVLISSVFQPVFAEEREGMGLPECQLIVGTDRHIEIGNTISYTLEYMENNKYRCDDFQGKSQEMVSCTYRLDSRFEVLLVVENGIVKDIETFYANAECSYFNLLPPPDGVVDDGE